MLANQTFSDYGEMSESVFYVFKTASKILHNKYLHGVQQHVIQSRFIINTGLLLCVLHFNIYNIVHDIEKLKTGIQITCRLILINCTLLIKTLLNYQILSYPSSHRCYRVNENILLVQVMCSVVQFVFSFLYVINTRTYVHCTVRNDQ